MFHKIEVLFFLVIHRILRSRKVGNFRRDGKTFFTKDSKRIVLIFFDTAFMGDLTSVSILNFMKERFGGMALLNKNVIEAGGGFDVKMWF